MPDLPESEPDAAAALSTAATRHRGWLRRRNLIVAGALVAGLVATIVAWRMSGELPVIVPVAPTATFDPPALFQAEIDAVMAGKSRRLYTTPYTVRNEMLATIPIERLTELSNERRAREQATAEERAARRAAYEAIDEYDRDDEPPLPPGRLLAPTELGTMPDRGVPVVMLDTVLIDEGIIDDDGLAILARLPDLEHLRLRLSPITDKGIESLVGCPNLQVLNLPHSRVTAAGLAMLKKLPRLRQLRLASENLTSESCRVIAELTSLRGLHLIGVPVTDDGLKMLATLPHLESLYLDDAAVTDAGWVWLFRNHPQLHVHVNESHHDRDPHAHKH